MQRVVKIELKRKIIDLTLLILNDFSIEDVKVSFFKTNRGISGEVTSSHIRYDEKLLNEDLGGITFTILHEISHVIANKIERYNCEHGKV